MTILDTKLQFARERLRSTLQSSDKEEGSMSTWSRNRGIVTFSLISLALILACAVSTTAPTASPAFDTTKAVLELQGTAMSLQLTQAAINSEQRSQPVVAEPTNAPPATAAPTEVPAVPTADVEARIEGAKLLVYENTDERGIGMWV